MTCPAFGPHPVELVIRFDDDGLPSVDSASFPSGFRVVLLNAAPGSTVAVIEIQIPLGQASDIFGAGISSRQVEIVADASEKVSGQRRTSPPLPVHSKRIEDPRPPVLKREPWAIHWSGLPNSQTGLASALLPLPVADGPPIRGFQAWRANETGLLDLALAQTFEDSDQAADILRLIRAERDKVIRLRLIQSVVEPLLGNADFEQSVIDLFRADSLEFIDKARPGVEVSLPASQIGFEFFIFNAVSATGVVGQKKPSMVLRAVAVPTDIVSTPPHVRLVNSDNTGLFEHSGMCLALVTHPNNFPASAVRFFWAAGGNYREADELMEAIVPLQDLAIADAVKYVPEIEALARSLPNSENVRGFLLQPSAAKSLHNIAVDLRLSTPGDKQLPLLVTSRSNLESVYLG